jgi:Flp pilus assembly CpaE family ATPase
MPTILILSARGGSGASLLASNLGVFLSQEASCVLLDLHGGEAVDDLLLDLQADPRWSELAGAHDPTRERLGWRAWATHPSGLRLIAGGVDRAAGDEQIGEWVQALSAQAEWVLVDAPSARAADALLHCTDLVFLVAMLDPPTLRAAQRWLAPLPQSARRKVALIVNQVTGAHPLQARGAAHALQLPLWATLPADAAPIGRQIHFGEAAVQVRASRYGRAVRQLARRLQASRAQPFKTGERPPERLATEGSLR